MTNRDWDDCAREELAHQRDLATDMEWDLLRVAWDALRIYVDRVFNKRERVLGWLAPYIAEAALTSLLQIQKSIKRHTELEEYGAEAPLPDWAREALEWEPWVP